MTRKDLWITVGLSVSGWAIGQSICVFTIGLPVDMAVEYWFFASTGIATFAAVITRKVKP